MNGFAFILVAYFALNAILSVAFIGKEREPITPGAAVFMLIIYGLLIKIVFVAVTA